MSSLIQSLIEFVFINLLVVHVYNRYTKSAYKKGFLAGLEVGQRPPPPFTKLQAGVLTVELIHNTLWPTEPAVVRISTTSKILCIHPAHTKQTADELSLSIELHDTKPIDSCQVKEFLSRDFVPILLYGTEPRSVPQRTMLSKILMRR